MREWEAAPRVLTRGLGRGPQLLQAATRCAETVCCSDRGGEAAALWGGEEPMEAARCCLRSIGAKEERAASRVEIGREWGLGEKNVSGDWVGGRPLCPQPRLTNQKPTQ
jgi:hypothetical protein